MKQVHVLSRCTSCRSIFLHSTGAASGVPRVCRAGIWLAGDLRCCTVFWGFLYRQAKLEQAKLAAKVMNVATPGTSSCSGSGCGAELKGSNVQSELKSMQHGLGMSRQLA